MARDLGELNREDFARYKDDVKKEGKPFFPHAIFHDTVMSLVVVGVIVGARGDLVLRRRRREARASSARGTRSRPIRARRTSSRAPTGTSTSSSTSSGSSSGRRRSFIATVGIPTICLILLIGLPFFDRRRERRPLHRPVAMVAAVLTILSMARADVEGRDGEGGARLRARRCSCPTWAEEQGFAGNEEATKGADAVRAVRLPQLPHLPRLGRRQPRRARPVGDRRDERRRRTSSST